MNAKTVRRFRVAGGVSLLLAGVVVALYGSIWVRNLRDLVKANLYAGYEAQLLSANQEIAHPRPDMYPAFGHFNRGYANVMLGRFEEAWEDYENGKKADPKGFGRRSGSNRLAMGFAENGRYTEAKKMFEEALAVSPDERFVLNQYAYLLVHSHSASVRDARRALQLTQRLLSLSDHEADRADWTIHADALALAGRFPEAIEAAKKARSLPATSSNFETEENEKLEEKINTLFPGKGHWPFSIAY
ncbi:MAG: Tetratricopeptide repeat [Candidatus Peribacteria bacterium]|nr:Tetratricopeptide repeat [Candidatus Peribacteria bacterium]